MMKIYLPVSELDEELYPIDSEWISCFYIPPHKFNIFFEIEVEESAILSEGELHRLFEEDVNNLRSLGLLIKGFAKKFCEKNKKLVFILDGNPYFFVPSLETSENWRCIHV